LKNGVYNSVGGIVRLAVALVLVPLLIRVIGTTEYGVWSLAFAIVGISAITEVGLSSAVTVFASRDVAENDHKSFSETLTVSLVASVLLGIIIAISLWLGAELIVGSFSKLAAGDHAMVVKALHVGSILVLARFPQQVFIGVQQAFQRFGILNAILTVQSLAIGIGLVGVSLRGGRTIEFMTVQAAVAILALLAHSIAAFRLLYSDQIRFNWNRHKTREMFRFGLLSTLSNLGGVFFTQCDRLIVGAFLDTASLGLYAGITTVTSQINTVSALPVQPLLARVSNLSKRETSEKVRNEIQHTLQFNAALAFGLGAAIFTAAPTISNLLFHANSSPTVIIALRCASVIYATYSLNASGYFILPAIGKLSAHTVIQICGGALSLMLIWIGATRWGLPGAVGGNIGFVSTLLLTTVGLKTMNIPLKDAALWLKFPAIWMGVTIGLAALIPQTLPFECALLVIASLVLGWWALRLFPVALLPNWLHPKAKTAA
jgi:O-antigen/teichoic acid export membrane protein